MTTNEKLLWQRVKDFALDQNNISFTFSDRLARENNWDFNYTQKVIEEYKKFMFLCAVQPNQVTPSEDVDQVWHLHLTYTKSYWDDFCKNILEKNIHHIPTKGGTTEKDKFVDYYLLTLQLYENYFEESPPQDVWPNTTKRFAQRDLIWVDKSENKIIPIVKLHRFIIGVVFFGIIIFNLIVQQQLAIMVSFLILFILFAIYKPITTSPSYYSGSGGCSGGGCATMDGGCGGDSGCGSGCSGCGGGCGGCGS